MTDKGNAARTRSRVKVLIKIISTLLAGGVVFLVTNLSGNQPLTFELTISLLVGGITLLVQFLHEFESRLAKVEERQEYHSAEMYRLINNGFARTNKMTELHQAVEESALQTDAVIQMVQNSTRIASSPQLLCKFAQLQIDRTSEFLEGLSGGKVIEYDGEDQDWILWLTMRSQHSIDATSLSAVDAGGKGFDGGLWTSDHGQRYLQRQEKAMNRGVTIRRVFIIERPEQADEADFLRIYQQHKNLGIKVRFLERSEISASLVDFVVFDRVLSYEVTPEPLPGDAVRPTIVNTRLKLDPEEVRERIHRFENLWTSARDLA